MLYSPSKERDCTNKNKSKNNHHRQHAQNMWFQTKECINMLCSSNLLGQEEHPKTRRADRIWKSMYNTQHYNAEMEQWSHLLVIHSLAHSLFVRSAIMLYINGLITPGTLLWCRQESSSGNYHHKTHITRCFLWPIKERRNKVDTLQCTLKMLKHIFSFWPKTQSQNWMF